jgi:long-chain acyl-CoA synthetase
LSASTLAELAADPAVAQEVASEVDDVNQRFSRAEQIRRFKILGDDWLPDSEELTPTMKLKRRGILAKYSAEIADLYLESSSDSSAAIVT